MLFKPAHIIVCLAIQTLYSQIESKSVSIHTGISDTQNTILLTLLFDGIDYECQLNPTDSNTIYSCTHSHYTIIGPICPVDQPSHYRMLIDLPDTNSVAVQQDTTMENNLGIPYLLCYKPTENVEPIVKSLTIDTMSTANNRIHIRTWQAGIAGFQHFNSNKNLNIPFKKQLGMHVPNTDQTPMQNVFWNAYQNSILNAQSNQSWDAMHELYQDLHAMNTATNHTVVGTIVLCTDEKDNNFADKIGPDNFNESLKKYFPVNININFNLNDILIVRQMDNVIDNTVGMIKIWAHFYAVCQDDISENNYQISEAIESELFPNGTDSKYWSLSSENMIGEWIVFSIVYNDFEAVYDDIGCMDDLHIKYNKFYFVPVSNELVIYLFGITLAFENEMVLHEYMNWKTETKTHTTEAEMHTPETKTPKTGYDNKYGETHGSESNSKMLIAVVLCGLLIVIAVTMVVYIMRGGKKTKKEGYTTAKSMESDGETCVESDIECSKNTTHK